MKVKLNNAVKIFFGNASFEMVYFEAIANALDAMATKIDIDIKIEDISHPESLIISIKDNGVGFTDNRFVKFSNLFDTEDTSHKGLGRLVYLFYFEKVRITSYYDDTSHREFEFSDSFDEKKCVVTQVNKMPSGSTLTMTGYSLSKLGKKEFVNPKYIKDRILEKFYSRLYKLKKNDNNVEISISAKINKKSQTTILKTSEIHDFKQVQIENTIDFFSNIELYYHIEETPTVGKVITAISVDDRTYPIDIIAEENFPINYNIVFLLYSDFFNGKADASREALSITKSDMEHLQTLFRNKIATIIQNEIPTISESNQRRKQQLVTRYPHLIGYFENDKIGYASQDELLKKAQETFFREQREILDATHLDDEQYQKSLLLASRTLAEYILFRQNTINKLKTIDFKDNESVIHNLIVPMKEKFSGVSSQNDLYRNNVWVLDDKYMTYDTILSDKEMTDVIKVITAGEVVDNDQDRPDIALVFSGNPNIDNTKVNVVIIELKKKGLSTENNSIVEVQLENRARKLLKYYSNRIQQIWFYGIVEFNEEYVLHLASNDFHSLYSNGNVFYKNKEIAIQTNPIIKIPAGMFIMDYNAVVNDANARNSTFLNIIKSKFPNK